MEVISLIQNIVHGIAPNAKSPITYDSRQNPKSDLASYNSEKLLGMDQQLFKFDVCPKLCCAFVGINKNLIRCPKCNEPRFHNCSICGANEDKMYDQRQHHFSSNNSTPIESLAYRLFHWNPLLSIFSVFFKYFFKY